MPIEKARSPGRLKTLCFILIFWLVPAYPQKKPNFDEIVAKFIEKVESDSLYIGDNYNHQEFEISENIKNGIIYDAEQRLYQVEKRTGDLYKKLIAKDGIPVTDSGFQQKKELVSFGTKLLTRYDFNFERNEKINDEEYFVFSFKPKKNLPQDVQEDKAINELAGEVWINQENLTFKMLTANLLSEVDISLAKIGSVRLRKIRCKIVAKTIDGRFAIDRTEVEYIYTAKIFHFFTIFSNKHELKKIRYQNYERRTK